jgi:hypothetical protein
LLHLSSPLQLLLVSSVLLPVPFVSHLSQPSFQQPVGGDGPFPPPNGVAWSILDLFGWEMKKKNEMLKQTHGRKF